MTWFTLVAASIIAAPMGLWLAGVGPAVMLVVNASALILTLRLYAVAAGLARNRIHLMWLGLFSGLIGGLAVELLLHVRGAADLATAFSAYASLGAEMYRLDIINPWWPFAFVVLNGLFYAGIALLVGHLVQYRRRILGLEDNASPR
jgi:hypothetical protein